MTKPKGFYLSYSRINLYYHSPEEYFMRYVLGHCPKPTSNMEFGKIGHKALEDRKFNWRKALRDGRFLSRDESVIENAQKQIKQPDEAEIEFAVRSKWCLLYGIWDGIRWIDKTAKRGEIDEYKFSGLGVWNAEKVNDDLQLNFYAYAFSLRYKRVPDRLVLYHINRANGSVKKYPVPSSKRSKSEWIRRFKGIENIIEYCYDGITNARWEQ